MKNLSPIIPVISPECQAQSWKKHLKDAVSTPEELLHKLGLNDHPEYRTLSKASQFPMRVPQPFIDKMEYGNSEDPLLKQVLPMQQEDEQISGYGVDPLAEIADQQPGLIQKYKGRLLLMLASACAVNCRYCFRRHFPYDDKVAIGQNLTTAIESLSKDHSISEVILSGGDPLIVSDHLLEEVVTQLGAFSHIKRLRIHTRLPVVIPQRVTNRLCQTLEKSRLKCSIVLHINHPNEIDSLLANQLEKLVRSGTVLLNQSVLLKGINDSEQIISSLSEKLFDAGILPYYVHLLDKVQGAAHFDVDEESAIKILENARKHLPGYLVPRLAREIPGEASKTIIA